MPQAMIIRSEKTKSRTILSHNTLPAFPISHFKEYLKTSQEEALDCIHFEGRAVPETYQMIQTIPRKVIVSVELEKPYRAGIDELGIHSDIVFFSKAFVLSRCKEWQIEIDPRTPQDKQIKYFFGTFYGKYGSSRDAVKYLVTWGDLGAFAMKMGSTMGVLIHEKAVTFDQMPVVDTNGAGDTFIGAFLYYYCKDPMEDLRLTLQKSVYVASLKCTMDGFKGLRDQIM